MPATAEAQAQPTATDGGKTHLRDFNVTTAVLAAGFAFEAYNEPSENDARWERGADGIDVAFMSEDFAREVYDGILEVRLCEVRDLEKQKGLTQALMSGGQRDPYVLFAMNEENEEGPKEGAIGLGRAVDRVRSSTVWSKSLIDQWAGGSSKDGAIAWPEDERMYLYVKDPSRAQLAMTVFDEEVVVGDLALGATSLHVADLFNPRAAAEKERQWSGWVPMSWRPEETQDNTVMIGTVAGAAMGGPAGAAAGGFLGSLIKKPPRGEVRLEIKYMPFAQAQGDPAGSPKLLSPQAGDAEANSTGKAPVLASGAAPKGGSEGIDWSILAKRVGVAGDEDVEGYELCCFLTHSATSSEVAIWRKRSTRFLVVAFRGTSDVIDALTDVKFVQTPLEQGYRGQKSDDPRRVHSGFFESAKAVNRRLKELLVAACAGSPGEWEVLITGHSLGGALASMVSPDLVGRVNTMRGFKEREDQSWLARASRFFSADADAMYLNNLPSFGRVKMYTFGAPRVGNSEFVRYFNEVVGSEAFRIVNDRDVVPRLPRSGSVASAVGEYEHVGRTVLIAENAAEADGFDGFWIEGTSDDAACPLRDVSPLSNPFSSGELLGDVGQKAMDYAAQAGQAWEKIDQAAKVKSRSQLESALSEASEGFGRTTADIADRVKRVSENPFEAVSLVGFSSKFVESEIKLAESLTSGKAIEHHLEPSYFVSMTKALDASGTGV